MEFPSVFLDVAYLKGRVAHQVVARAVVATGIALDGSREVLGRVSRQRAQMVSAAIGTIFTQPDARSLTAQFARIEGTLRAEPADVGAMLEATREELLAFCAFPRRTLAQALVDEPPIRGSIAGSSAGVTSSGRSRTIRPCSASAPSSSRPTTSGRSPSGAICRRPRWPSSSAPSTPPRPSRLDGDDSRADLASAVAPRVLPELDIEKVRRFCERHISDARRDEVRLEVSVRGRRVSIHERRPPWTGAPGEWTRMAVAQLRSEDDGSWSLYFGDRNGKWVEYFDLDGHRPIDVIINVLEADPTCLFWG